MNSPRMIAADSKSCAAAAGRTWAGRGRGGRGTSARTRDAAQTRICCTWAKMPPSRTHNCLGLVEGGGAGGCRVASSRVEEAANDEDGLIVWLGRVCERTEISGFVDEADVQGDPQKKLWPPDGGHRVSRPHGDRRSRISRGGIWEGTTRMSRTV